MPPFVNASAENECPFNRTLNCVQGVLSAQHIPYAIAKRSE